MHGGELDHPFLEALAGAARRAAEPVSLTLHRGAADHRFGDRLAAVARWVHEGTGGAVALTDGDGHGPLRGPALTLGCGSRAAVHYLAVPKGEEEAPFLEALLALACGDLVAGTGSLLHGLQRETHVQVFMGPGCPSCPHAVRAAVSLAAGCPLLTASIVDVTSFAQHAEAFAVRSVPTTVIGGDLTLVGIVARERLAAEILEREGPAGERAVFRSLVQAGRFDAAARRLCDGSAHGPFAEMWRTSTLEVRIGLVLAAEEALADHPAALDGLAGDLLPVLEGDDPARLGDTADLLGRIGNAGALAALETLLVSSHSDVAEAAADAMAAIRSRGERPCPTASRSRRVTQ